MVTWNVSGYDRQGFVVLGAILVVVGLAILEGYVTVRSEALLLAVGAAVSFVGTVVFITAQRPGTNVGGYDRVARVVFGPLLLAAGIALFGGYLSVGSGVVDSVLGALAVFLGAAFVVTAKTQACPINAQLGVDTYR